MPNPYHCERCDGDGLITRFIDWSEDDNILSGIEVEDACPDCECSECGEQASWADEDLRYCDACREAEIAENNEPASLEVAA